MSTGTFSAHKCASHFPGAELTGQALRVSFCDTSIVHVKAVLGERREMPLLVTEALITPLSTACFSFKSLSNSGQTHIFKTSPCLQHRPFVQKELS